MPSQERPFDLNLSFWQDEELVSLAKECDSELAVNELCLRYWQWLKERVAKLASTVQLRAEDIEDAQQEAIFWLRETVAKYDLRRFDQAKSFVIFLRCVVRSRFWDFVKHRQREEAHLHDGMRPAVALDEVTNQVDGTPATPDAIVELHELTEILCDMVDHLDEGERKIFQAFLVGTTAGELAIELGTCAKTARQRQERLLAKMKGRLSRLTA